MLGSRKLEGGRLPIGKAFARRILRVALLIQVSWWQYLSSFSLSKSMYTSSLMPMKTVIVV